MKVLLVLKGDSLLDDNHWGVEKSEKDKMTAFIKEREDFFLVLDRDYLFPDGYILEETVEPADEGKHNSSFIHLRVSETIEMLRENYLHVLTDVQYMEFIKADMLIEHLTEKWLSEADALKLLNG